MGAGRLIASGLEPAISREKSLGAFETLLGTAEQARDMYGQAVKFAAETPFETAQVVDSFQRLLTARFSQEEVPIAMRIIGDAASMQEDSQMAVASVTRALSQIRSKGKLQGEELMQLQEAVPLNTAELYERLGKIYGTNAQAARKMQEAGQIDSQVASFAILAQLQQQFGGNMERSSKQIGGLISTLRSRPSELLSQLQDTRGYSALSDALTRLTSAWSDVSPAGVQLQEIINDLGSGALDRVAALIDYASAGVSGLFSGVRAGLGPMTDAFGKPTQTDLQLFGDNMRAVGVELGKVAGFMKDIASFVEPVGKFFDYLAKDRASVKLAPFQEEMIRQKAMREGVFSTGTSAGTTQERLLRDRREQEVGGFVGSSVLTMEPETGGMSTLVIPEAADGGIVRRRTLLYAGEAGPEAIVPLNGVSTQIEPLRRNGGGGGIQISMPITINGMSESGASSVGQSIMAQVEPVLMAILERWQLQAGRA